MAEKFESNEKTYRDRMLDSVQNALNPLSNVEAPSTAISKSFEHPQGDEELTAIDTAIRSVFPETVPNAVREARHSLGSSQGEQGVHDLIQAIYAPVRRLTAAVSSVGADLARSDLSETVVRDWKSAKANYASFNSKRSATMSKNSATDSVDTATRDYIELVDTFLSEYRGKMSRLKSWLTRTTGETNTLGDPLAARKKSGAGDCGEAGATLSTI
mgnify:CR=1 FL=1